MRETTIKMELSSGLLMAEVGLWSRDEQLFRNMNITVDTGASVTTISKDILLQLGYVPQNKGKAIITTASGIEYVDRFVLDKMKLGTMEISGILAYGHIFPEESFSLGVLGLNVLRQFDIQLLFGKRLMTFFERNADN
jgi:predicted aspartyl protease